MYVTIVPAATLYWIIWFYRASSNVEPKAITKWSREQTSQVATSINLKCTICTKHKIFMVIACMCICINIFTDYAVYDYYRENHLADQSSRILPQDSCYSSARLHYFRTGLRFSSLHPKFYTWYPQWRTRFERFFYRCMRRTWWTNAFWIKK